MGSFPWGIPTELGFGSKATKIMVSVHSQRLLASQVLSLLRCPVS